MGNTASKGYHIGQAGLTVQQNSHQIAHQVQGKLPEQSSATQTNVLCGSCLMFGSKNRSSFFHTIRTKITHPRPVDGAC